MINGKMLGREAVRALSAKLKGSGLTRGMRSQKPEQTIGEAAIAATSEPVLRVLDRIREHHGAADSVRQTSPGQYEARCPAHDDSRASLSIHQGKGGKAVLHCHAGCSPAEVCAELGLRFNDLFPAKRKAGNVGEIIAEYAYCDEQGELLYQVCRMQPKDFRQRRPDGKGGWTWNMQGVRRVLYRLPELIAADPAAWAFVVEGEKDADRLAKAGLVSTCNVGGAGKWRSEYGEHFKGRRVCIIADKDAPGRKHSQQVARALTGVAGEVRIVECPGETVKDASDWFDAGGTAEQLLQLAEQAAPFNPQSVAAAIADDVPYTATPVGIMWAKPSRDGTIDTLLCNFTARIVAEVERDDGAETERMFQVQATLNGRTVAFVVSASRFAAMNWPVEHLGAGAIIFASQSYKDHARVAIQLTSPHPIPRHTVYTHCGWRQTANGWMYLHAAGGIGESGNVEGVQVELPASLAPYALPAPAEGEQLTAAIRASLHMLTLGPALIVFPVYAAIWRAVLGQCDFGLHLAGASGVFKSELAALDQQHFGAGLDARHLPGSWASTDNALEGLLFAAKDALTVIDDFAPSGGLHDIARWHQKADRTIRAQGNNSARVRMRADGSLRPPKPPRGLVFSTGEDVPRGQSLRARMLIVEVSKGDIAPDVLTECQRDARRGIYAAVMAAFLRWLAPRFDDVRQSLRADVERLRDEAIGCNSHNRTPEVVANLAVGLKHFIAFAVDSGAMTEAEGRQLWQRGWEALQQAGAAQAGHQLANEPARRFVELLLSAIASGAAHVAGPDGLAPQNPEAWGWRLVGNVRPADWRPSGARVGWLDGEHVYLLADAAHQAAQTAAGSGDGLAVSARTLAKRLAEKGWLVRGEADRLTVCRVLESRRRDVLCIPAAILSGESGISGIPGITPSGEGENADKCPIPVPENAPPLPEIGHGNRAFTPTGGPENGDDARNARNARKGVRIPPPPVYRRSR